MPAARAALPPAATARRAPWPEATRWLAGLLGAALLQLAGIAATLALLAGAYAVKRALGLDLIPGIDMLPDAEIEALLQAVFDLS